MLDAKHRGILPMRCFWRPVDFPFIHSFAGSRRADRTRRTRFVNLSDSCVLASARTYMRSHSLKTSFRVIPRELETNRAFSIKSSFSRNVTLFIEIVYRAFLLLLSSRQCC